ncbi:MAG: lamin tail domain-containing protein [Acidobacteriota bacterium]
MSVKKVALAALLCALAFVPPAAAQDFKTIFNGEVGNRRVVAVSVPGTYPLGELIDDLRVYAAPNTTFLAYGDLEPVSETEPMVVYVDGENVAFTEKPPTSTVPPTFGDMMEGAMIVERGDKIGAICRDGSRTDRTNNGACSFNGGLDRWLYEGIARSDAERVVAAICNDYRLVAGDGERCGRSEVLTPIRARVYTDPEPVDPATMTAEPEPAPPSERAVAPLPEPDVVPPTVIDSRVAWTSRSNGRVGFTWTTDLTNPNEQPVRAKVTAHLRDAAGEIVFSNERFVVLAAGARGEFTNDGAVPEETAMQGQRWTFDVALSDEDAPLTAAELASVKLEVDPLVEEVHITNTSDAELDLNGWTLASMVGGESFTFRFFRLGAGKTVTLTSGEGARSLLPQVYLWTSREVWDDQGDAAELRDAQGRLRARTNPDGTSAALDGTSGRRAGG